MVSIHRPRARWLYGIIKVVILMDMMMLLLLFMMLPQLLGGVGGLFGLGGSTAPQQPVINIYSGSPDEDGNYSTSKPGEEGNVLTGRANPLGGDEDNPFDLALAGAAIGGVAGAYLGFGLMSWMTAPIGAAIGGIGGFLIDLWWL